ncbi:cardiomyopathy-associated protein 5-like [Carassius auratus]|uniref:Cardiomyopathy-associated protein 5-like n=1 Tax=Carassius auratus TaxID=7957 RepID=A0A6P6NII3_CARAU|nr:cardiomyopathy-associated protein 5-like [Carassius auratus]
MSSIIDCRFELLHDSVESDIFVMDIPVRICTLLDYSQGQLFFFNAQNGQLLGTFRHAFTRSCHPVVVLEYLGSLELKMTTEVPEFVKHC